MLTHVTTSGQFSGHRKRAQMHESAEQVARRANEALRALSKANAALIHAVDETDLFRRVCEALTDARGYLLVWVGLVSHRADCVVDVAAESGEARSYLDGLYVTYDDGPYGQGPTGRAIRTGEVQVLRDIDVADEYTPWRQAARDHGFRASASLPLRGVDDRIVGTLNVYATESNAFDDQELPLLQELVSDLGFGLRILEIRAERDRQLAQLRLAGTVFDSSAEGIVVTDSDARIETVNKSFVQITGYTAEEAIGRRPGFLQSGIQKEEFYQELWSQLRREGYWQGEIWNRRCNGEVYPEWLSISEVRDESGELTNYVGIFADLTQTHRYQQELNFLTYHDPLTELPNRVMFREQLQEALEEPTPYLAVMLIDLLGFRALNESFGVEQGDKVLAEMASRLRGVVRSQDLIARPGGDEFWVTIQDEANHVSVEGCIRDLIKAISAPLTIGDETVRMEANMGVALVPEDGTGVDEVLTNAAAALHRAQERSPGQVEYFEPTMQETVQRRVRMEEALKMAMDRDELRVWYQPQVALTTGSVCGAEALVRWQHREWGLVPPADFIPLAESLGIMPRIGDWVLEQALQRLAYWRANGYPIARVSVNAAATQIQQPDWADHVQQTLERIGVPAHCLEIEITEERALRDLDAALTTMESLRARGVRLAIDDFGKGYSSLVYLKQFPINTLKIDKAFISGLPHVPYGRSITEAILAVSRALDFDVVAEGVETKAEADWLKAQAVQEAQGFYYFRPQPPEQIETLFDED